MRLLALLLTVALTACSSPDETTTDCSNQVRFEGARFAESLSSSDIERMSEELNGS